ncbi:MAG TPA: hypothetical protein VGQ99_12475 [Tepidisphaeraceae bacterium]|jgi:hypothetical protein|nr:hypothetical protein [Tepidisphaeraceae bacterium]
MQLLANITWGGIEHWPVALLGLGLAAGGVALFYGQQARALAMPWRWVLPALRVSALLALAISILRPVLIRVKSSEEQGAVLVVFDRSMSMSALDRTLSNAPERGRVVGQLVALADGLGKLVGSSRIRAMADVHRDIRGLELLAEDVARTHREVEYARLSGRDPQEAHKRFEAAIGSFQGAISRAQSGAKALSPRPTVVGYLAELSQSVRPGADREKWLKATQETIRKAVAAASRSQEVIGEELYRSDPQVRLVCDELSRMSRFDLCWEGAWRPDGLFTGLSRNAPMAAMGIGDEVLPMTAHRGANSTLEFPAEPTGASSDLTGGIRKALQQLGRQPVQAVVLFSDGRQVGASAPIQSGLLASGVPIFTVYAAPARVRDLSIARVDMPASVFVDEQLTVHVEPKNLGLDVTRLTGEATAGAGGELIARKPLLRDSKLEPIEFSMSFRSAGVEKITINLPIQENESATSNNQVDRWVKVLSQKLKVTAISGSPGWDFRYLRELLSRTPWVELRDPIVVPGVSALAMSGEELGRQDLIILNDLPDEALNVEQWEAISRLVHERGGSVIVIPGISNVQQEYMDEAFLPYSLAKVRPAWRTWPGPTPHYRMVPEPNTENLDFLKLDENAPVSRRRWEELPGFYRFLAIPELKSNVRTLLVERESHSPLLTETRVGNGRAFFLAMNETWRWRCAAGDREQDRFWLQLVRHAVDEPYTLASEPLSLDLEKVVAEPEESIRVRARLTTRKPAAGFPKELQLSIMQNEEEFRSEKLSAIGAEGDGRYAGELSGLPEGQYDVKVWAPIGDGSVTELTLPLKIERNSEAEMADLSGDRDFLQRLADASGGACINLDQIDTLPRLVSDARLRQPRTAEIDLWDSAYLFLFVISCLTAEWALRKRLGLA